MNIFEKIKFILKRPKVIIVTGEGHQATSEVIFRVLKPYFQIGKEVLIFETDSENIEKFKFLASKSSMAVLVASETNEKIRELAKMVPSQGFLVFNSDDKELERVKGESLARCLTFGFEEGADFQASDIKLNGDTNFKINYQGKVVPVWLEGICDKEKISAGLAVAVVGTIFGLNLIEISQALREIQKV